MTRMPWMKMNTLLKSSTKEGGKKVPSGSPDVLPKFYLSQAGH